jgi:hypothetical protein
MHWGSSVSKEHQIKLKQLEAYRNRLDGLEVEYDRVSEQINYTTNASDRTRLTHQLNALGKEMGLVAQQYDQLEQELKTLSVAERVNIAIQPDINIECLRSLSTILAPHEAALSSTLEIAYRSARPEGWLRPVPDTLRGKLIDLEDMQPDEMGNTAVLKFVAHLVIDARIPQQLQPQLEQWAEQQGQEFLKRFRQQCLQERQPRGAESDRYPNAYLMVVVDRQNSGVRPDEAFYFVKAWAVPNAEACQSQSGAGFQPLPIPGTLEDAEKSVNLDGLRQVLSSFLEEAGKRCSLAHLTVELFLPSDLLNHPFDSWILDAESDFAPPLGMDYRVIVRSSERLREAYLARRGSFWQRKWRHLQQCLQESADSLFVLGDGENPKRLYQQLSSSTIVGLKLAQEPLSFGKNSAFAVLQEAGIPVALWLRQQIPDLNCVAEVNELLNCTIHIIPERVKTKRGDAWSEEVDCHIGHHLALMWEDCDRLPPDLDYYMP